MDEGQALAILEPAATRVRDPLSGRSLWLAGMIQGARLDGDTLRFTLAASPAHQAPDLQRMREALLRNLESLGWKGDVDCRVRPAVPAGPSPGAGSDAGHGHDHGHQHGHGHEHGHSHEHGPAQGPGGRPGRAPLRGMEGGGMQPHGGPILKKAIPGVRRIIAVASGKGGVGKSTVASNLAVALARQGWRVGLMDADIYGPSVPTMFAASGKVFANDENRVVPKEAHGIRLMSIGFLVPEDEPIIWRGPMVMGVVKQFLQDVAWGDLDALIVDLPPGTGDAQLTMIQAVDIAGAVIVTTPQDVAVLDAVRGIEMFRKLEVPVLGVVENMAFLDLPDGSRLHPFGEGGGRRTAERYHVPLLAQVPLDGAIREAGDAGRPVALRDDGAGAAFHAVAAAIRQALP